MRKRRALLVVAALVAATLAAALVAGAGASPVPVPAPADLRWGGDSEGGAPYVFPDPQDPSRIVGYEVDLANALGVQLGRRAVFVQNQWDGLIPGLQRGNYDIVLNGLEITDDRRAEIDFTIPYYATAEQLSVRVDAPEVGSLSELQGKRAGTLKYSLAERILRRTPGIDVRTYDGQINVYEDLANGRLDAVLMDWPIALYYSKPNPKLKFTGPPIEALQYGIGVRKTDTALRAELDGALRRLATSGELQRIYEKWGLWNTATAELFAAAAAAPSALDDYTQAVTRRFTWRERAGQYAGYLRILLLRGAPMTLAISILGMALAITLGLGLALVNLYGARPFAALARAYIEIVRGTPLLIQLYLIFYGLPNVGIRLSPFVAAILGLGMNYAAYEAENYRAGIQSIPRGQMEAALSLGMTQGQALRHVVVPQSMRVVLPPVTNDFIALFKDSSIVSVITMVELTKVYGQLASTYYDYIGIGLLVAAIYFLLGWPFVRLAKWAESRWSLDKRAVVPARRRWLGVGAKPH